MQRCLRGPGAGVPRSRGAGAGAGWAGVLGRGGGPGAAGPHGIEFRERLRDLALYEPHGDELPLAHKVLDRQIIDVHGRRVVRVHDLLLERTNGHYRLVGVDSTPRAMLRRLGLERPTPACSAAWAWARRWATAVSPGTSWTR